jgi:hypothetical protein
VTFDQPAIYVDLRITEYSSLAPSGAFDDAASASGTGGVASSGALVTSAPGELLFAAGMTGSVFTAPGRRLRGARHHDPDGDIVEDAIAASAGSHAARRR